MRKIFFLATYATSALMTSACSGRDASPPTDDTQAGAERTHKEALTPGTTWSNVEWPITALEPPLIERPLHACAHAVRVRGVLEGAFVEVYDDTDTLLGTGVGLQGSARVELNRGLVDGESIYAKQAANNLTSPASISQNVKDHEGLLPTPRIGENVWDCSQFAVVRGATAGAIVRLERGPSGNLQSDDNRWASQGEVSLGTKTQKGAGANGEHVAAYQTICPKEPSEKSSPTSAEEAVQTPPAITPSPTTVSAAVGSNWISAKPLYAGARVRTYRDPQPGGIQLTSGFVNDDAGNRWQSSTTVQSGWQIWATQSLCTESAPTPLATPTSQQEFENLLGSPKIVGPVCPSAVYVEVQPSIPEGRIALFKKDTPNKLLAQSGAGPDNTLIHTDGNLSSNDNLFAIQYTQSGIFGSASPVETVGSSTAFNIQGSQSYPDPNNPSNTLSGFLLEESRGPIFELRECCDGATVYEPIVEIFEGDSQVPYATIKLTQQYPGTYRGQWDFFIEDVNGEYPEPKANTEYSAIVTSPCQNEIEKVNFTVLTREADQVGDDLEVQLLIDGVLRGTPDVSLPVFIDVTAGEEIPLLIRGIDRDGVEEVEVDAISSSYVVGVTSKTHPPQPTLIAKTLSISPMTIKIPPGKFVSMLGRAKNFGSSATPVETNSVVLTALHEDPIINNISPDELFAYQSTIDINGEHLYYVDDDTETSVMFCPAGTTTGCHTTGPLPQFGTNHDTERLDDVAIPTTLVGQGGLYDVTVATTALVQGSYQTKTSNIVQLELLDRTNGTFSKSKVSDFKTTSPSTASCSGITNAINMVTTNQTTVFVSNGIANKSTPLNTFSYQGTNPFGNGGSGSTVNQTIGGVVLSQNCRTLLVLSQKAGSTGPAPLFTLNMIHSFETGEMALSKKEDIDLFVDTGQSYGYPNIASFMLSKDGTFYVAVDNDRQGGTSGNSVSYNMRMFDLLDGGGALAGTRVVTGIQNNCTYPCNGLSSSMSDGHYIQLFDNLQEQYSYDLR